VLWEKIKKTIKYPTDMHDDPKLKAARVGIYRQACLAGMTIVLTVVILFTNIAAWYTNVVESSGLLFEVAPWDFDGNVTVGDATMVIAPGDTGVIPIMVTNDSDNVVAVSVNISKAFMDEEMQKRLFFYVDTQQARDGEIMDRVYLSNLESYTYTMFGQGNLTLTEAVYNEAQLKWTWVYDVLGYYVLGTHMEDGSVTIHEYVRPIEYDYDEATTTFVINEENDHILEISTVDGDRTVEEFLVELSQNDGYEGLIDPDARTSSGYYPVDVDENGYGVWAYMCSYSEIETNIVYDTELGKAAATGEVQTYNARLSISAQKSDMDIVSVSTLAGLQQIWENGEVEMIRLTEDITISSGITLTLDNLKRLAIDLNGHTIYSNSSSAFYVEAGSELTLYNGTLDGNGNEYGLIGWGAEITMSDVKITGVDYPVYILDNTDDGGNDSKVRLVNCELEAGDIAVYVRGNGSASAQPTQVVIEDCVFNAKGVAIQGNGGYGGTDIQVIQSQIHGDVTAVFQPQPDSSLTISGNSVISGASGMQIKGGAVTVIDSTVTANGPKSEPIFGGSGCSDTGDAIYIETNYGYDIALEVCGNSILTSANGYSLQIYAPDADNVAVALYGGTYNLDVSGFLAPGAVMNQNGSEFTVTTPES